MASTPPRPNLPGQAYHPAGIPAPGFPSGPIAPGSTPPPPGTSHPSYPPQIPSHPSQFPGEYASLPRPPPSGSFTFTAPQVTPATPPPSRGMPSGIPSFPGPQVMPPATPQPVRGPGIASFPGPQVTPPAMTPPERTPPPGSVSFPGPRVTPLATPPPTQQFPRIPGPPPFSQPPLNAPPSSSHPPPPPSTTPFLGLKTGPSPIPGSYSGSTALPPTAGAFPSIVPPPVAPRPLQSPEPPIVLQSQTASSMPQAALHPPSVGFPSSLQVRGPPNFGHAPAASPIHQSMPSTGGGILGKPMPQNLADGPPGSAAMKSMDQVPQYRALGMHPQFGPNRPPPSTVPSYMDGQVSREPAGYPGVAPAFGSVQGLTEEFESLSIASAPDATIDENTLPRPFAIPELPASTGVANCHPRYLRLTCSSIPNSHSLVARWHLPLGAIVHPLAEAPAGEEVPVINCGAAGIVRCRRCRTYINPYVAFTDGGRRWRCNVCGLLNDVPADYFCPLDSNGRRRDADERPELSKGSVEYVAPTEYMVRPPMPPVYFFLIDVSLSAVRTGMLQVAVDTIKSCLDKLPGFPRTQIGFLTFDSALHFYNLKVSLTQPQMMVVADLDDPFVPMPDDLLVNLSESRSVVEALLDSIPSMFENNVNIESAFGPALRAVFMVMSQLGGKLLVFQSTLPSLGVGRLKIRGDDPRMYGTEKECSLRVPEDPFYKQMAADFSKYQIGVNIYAFSEKYVDLASLGTLSKYTGGQVFYYPSFQPHLHREKFSYELGRDLTRETAWEAVMRVRCGRGLRFNYFHGHFMLRSSDLMALPAVDSDKAFSMQLSLEDTLLTSQTVYFQVALLYTSSVGERRIRVHTLAAPVVTDLGELYRGADVGAIMSLLSRLAIEKTLSSKLEDARELVQVRLVRSLREYRNLYGVQHHVIGRLIYPESLKFLPLYCLSLCKSLALRGGYADVKADERSAMSYEMMIMSSLRLLRLLYPTLIRLDEYLLKDLKVGMNFNSLQTIPLTAARLDLRGAFLLSDGLRLVIWFGKVLPSDFIVHLLGMEAANSTDLSKIAVIEQNNDLSKRFMTLLKSLRERDPDVYPQCMLVRQGDQPREAVLMLFILVEDATAGSFGYADWMVQIHRQVQHKG